MVEKEFATVSVKRIFFKLALPSIFSMVFSSIYMMADGIFVGRFIGESALAAVNLIMPVMFIIFALSNMVAVGASVKVSTMLGEGKVEKAKNLFTSSMLIIVGIGFAFTIFGLIFTKMIVFSIIKDAVLAEMAYKYVRVFILGLPFIMPLFAIDNFLRACGKAKYSMWVNIIVALLNIVLDAVFIAVLKLGIEFSAIASVISMFLGAVFLVIPFFTKKITLHFARPKMSRREFVGIMYNGGSEFFSSVANSFICTVINVFLLTLGGAIAVASYGIVMYIDTLLIGILYGAMDAIQPAVSYNMGAKQPSRVFAFFKISSIATATLSVICMLIIMLFPKTLASVFAKGDNLEVINMTVTALLLFAPSYLFTWFNMVTSSFLTAMDKPKESIIIMAFRAVVFPLISMIVLTSFMGVYGVFLSATVAGAFTFIVALVIWIKSAKKSKQQNTSPSL